MNGDIKPPRPRKVKTNTPQPKTNTPELVAKESGALPEPDLTTIKPLEIDPMLQRAKKVSLSNIKANLHPRHWYNLTKEEQWVLFGGLLAIFIAIVLSSYFLVFKSNPAPTVVIHKKAVVKPVTAPAPLTGLPVDPALTKRPVTAIMVENSEAARPQSGLQDAGVVYEAIAEAGITRFMALFQDTRPQYIGPVSSL